MQPIVYNSGKSLKSHNLSTFFAPITILCALILPGCKTLNQNDIDHDFPGLNSAMNDKPIVCLLFVHGMGGYSNTPSDPAYIINSILKMPNIRQTAPETSVPFGDPDNLATLTRQDFVDTSDNHQLRAYTLDWEPLTANLKSQYLSYDQSTQDASRRLTFENNLRKTILDGSVPDVVLYVGDYKAAIQRAVKQALRKIDQQIESRDDKNSDYQYVFVTWSLGSKIVFDCLASAHITSGDSAASTVPSTDDFTFKRIAEKTYSVYMLANQIPLLTLGDIKVPAHSSEPPRAIPYENLLAVARTRKHATTRPVATTRPASSPLFIVAFSDPNDLLSYPIPPWLESSTDAKFANAATSVARTAYYIPIGSIDWIANPMTAHTAYGIDDRVVNLLLYGGKANEGK
jgi:hypothetical protein